MKKVIAAAWLILGPGSLGFAQQTIGLFFNTPAAYDGYTLFTPIKNTTSYLVDNCGELVHSWPSQYQPDLSAYLLENGTLLRAGKVPGPGVGNIVEMIDWNGNVTWSYSVPPSVGAPHHDLALLPNGHILMIVGDEHTQAEVIQAGSTTPLATIKSEQVIEVAPDTVNGGGTIVWTWKAWDHLVQDANPAKDHYGVVGNHPERIDINFLNHNQADWLHINGIDYNAQFDQINISVHNFSEFWVIDHGTTTAQAAGSSGGTYGKGGDLLYRWGNPQAYDQGTAADQQLFLQHNTHWIAGGLPGAGKILLFNNQAGTPLGQNYSTVNTLIPPVDSNGIYQYAGGAWGPVTFDWSWQAPVPTDFYSAIISGAQRLPDGNTLVCEGVPGRFFEIGANDSVVWQYVNPVNDFGPQVQGTAITNNVTFRCTRYGPSYPAFQGKTLTPMGYIETGSTFSCTLYPTGLAENDPADPSFSIYPNPAGNHFTVDPGTSGRDMEVVVCEITGKEVYKALAAGMQPLDVNTNGLSDGVYIVQVHTDGFAETKKLVISK